MQEQNEKKSRKILNKIGAKGLICVSLFAGIMVIVLGAVLYSYRHIPTSEWREANSGFPAKGIDIEIEELSGEWKSAKGNSRLELRTAYYPCVHITLSDDCKGSGLLFARFYTPNRRQQGSTITIPYRDGQFTPSNDMMIQTNGKKATVLLMEGYSDRQSYVLHQLNEQEALWKMMLWQQPAGTRNAILLGYTTLTPSAE
ncbi:MAG: hypothetical protein IKZ13_01635 [Akkermansia sp.]|nr:hypothetical protein [Akkermansia sp.]